VQSYIHSFTADERSGLHEGTTASARDAAHAAATTSLHFRPTSALAKTPVLLACSQDGSVRFFRVTLPLQYCCFTDATCACSITLGLKQCATCARVLKAERDFCPPPVLRWCRIVVWAVGWDGAVWQWSWRATFFQVLPAAALPAVPNLAAAFAPSLVADGGTGEFIGVSGGAQGSSLGSGGDYEWSPQACSGCPLSM